MRNSDRELPAVVTLVLISGALLVWAGYLFALRRYATGLWISLPPGVTIEVAFALVRRADRAAGRPRSPLSVRLEQETIALLAGGLMVLAGYAGRTWSWLFTAPFIVLGGAAIAVAIAAGRGPNVHTGRYTADIDGDFIVFLIGMRFNKPLKIHKWLPVATAMGKMLRVLDQHPELGCLGYRQWLGPTTVMIQYWRDFASLDRFARDTELPHLEPWRRFNRVVRNSGDVGIWHETYRVRAGEYETLYGNMPTFGLAAAARHVPVDRSAQSAATRIGVRPIDEPAVDPY